MTEQKLIPSVFDFSSKPASSFFRGLTRPRPFSTTPSHEPSTRTDHNDAELKLPKISSLACMIGLNALSQVSMFIVVSSASKYAESLGGTATFAGLVIGIPVVFAGLALIPLMAIDRGAYSIPIYFACIMAIIGHILYGLANYANFLYLILIGRCVIGFGFTNFMYSKRFCSDARIVGIRRRTTLAGWLVIGQGIGFSVGPFIGGLLYKVGFGNRVFNGYSSPGWVMAVAWVAFWAVCLRYFDDVPRVRPQNVDPPIQLSPVPFPQHTPVTVADESAMSSATEVNSISSPITHAQQGEDQHHISPRQWGVIATMCWFAMTCFFILGGWESNIPVYTAEAFGYSPFAAGNFIALGGIATFPFLLLNLYLVRRLQDRYILLFGTVSGMLGLLITLAILKTHTVTFGSLFVCWFLVALGFNVASTVTMSLLSKQCPPEWNGRLSLAIQYSNFSGRVSGAVWGGSGLKIGMLNYVGLEIALVGIGAIMFFTLWREMKAKTG
ncbi:hypothetical protein EW146_g8692 [Bondarzewia mesenterica]|uniref:Major facilitator superfamily (MFS) profile domain-containing protein n=1 Tax=Bondarzewia mesenterica TaxID=1095465 RepID=A0A4V3XDE0_9AGAM|nr:hypothetical protein EW146_g8692 [Bondarzewia mesenterica]